jgi:hypothetical protein
MHTRTILSHQIINNMIDVDNLQVNSSNLQKQLEKDMPSLNDIVSSGVRQFLGVESGPMEFPIPGRNSVYYPSQNMIEFLMGMKILEEKKGTKKKGPARQLNS